MLPPQCVTCDAPVDAPGLMCADCFRRTAFITEPFCSRCGVHPFYVPRSHPDQIDVNVRCLPAVDADALPRRPFDGQNWEQHVAALRGS